MGLDAVVYCDCYEKGRVHRPPPQPELVYVDANGQVCLRWDAPGADQNTFQSWLHDACDHGPFGQLVGHRLGNVARIGLLRRLLSHSAEEFPILLSKVLYNGVHAGDWLDAEHVRRLDHEMVRFRAIHSGDLTEENILREFEQQMSELITAAQRVGKPIAF